MVEPLPNYVQLVSGLSKATRSKARGAARALLAQAGLDDVAADAGERITKLAEEIISASRANRELLENLVTAEVDKAASRLGFVRHEDLAALQAQINALTLRVNENATAASGAEPAEAAAPPAKKAAAKKTPAKKAPAKKAPADKTPADKIPPKKSAAKKSAATRASATTTDDAAAAETGA